MPLQCQSAGSKHCLSAAVYLRGTAFKQQSQLFDTSPSHLSAQPSPDVTAHLPIKHSHKTLIHPLFRLYGPLLTQLPMITQSAFDFTTQTRAYVYARVCARREEGEGAGGPGRGSRHRHGRAKTARLYTDRHVDTDAAAHGPTAACTQTHSAHTQTQIFPLHPPPLCGLSLLALSCFPDCRWRPDRRAEWLEVRLCDDRPGPLSVTSTLPACCLKINWQIETQNCCRSRLTPCLFTYLFFFFSF